MFLKNGITVTFFTLLLVFFGGCEDSNFVEQSTDTNLTTSLGGVVVDGYISGATVCLDLDADSLCDANEPATISDEHGVFGFSSSDFSGYSFVAIIARGGVDTATNKAFEGELKTIIDTSTLSQESSIIINPLTDLVAVSFLRATLQDATALNDAIKEVADVFSITAADVLKDPMQNVALFAKVQEIQHLKELIYTSANKTYVADIGKNLLTEIKEALVTQIKESSDGVLNLERVLDTVEIQLNISIAQNEKDFIIAQIAEIKRALDIFVSDTGIDVNTLDRLQLALENELEEAYVKLAEATGDTTIDVVTIEITYAFITQSIFDKTDAILDERACLATDGYKIIMDSSLTPDRVSDDENGVSIKSEYEQNVSVEQTEVTLYYTDIEAPKTFNYIIKYEDNFSFSVDEAILEQSNKTIYVRTPKDENDLYGCYRAELNTTVASDITLVKVFRYSDI